jgi:flagellar L-ring protein precursor FlgH
MKTSMTSNKAFKGKGKTDQSNQLNGSISVTVVELLPNGNLKIRGEKRVTLNQGDEFVRLSGIVRPVDITPANVIDSQKIADATFMYTGEGSLADASTKGWLSRVFNSPWFPF